MPQQLLPAISNVVVNLTKGRLSAVPIQTLAGCNVLRVDDIRDYTPPSQQAIEPELRQAASQQAVANYVEGGFKYEVQL